MTIIGIDPGQEGGIAILHVGEYPIMHVMPAVDGIDEAGVRTVLEDCMLEARRKATEETYIMAWIEQVASMPKQGIASTFKFGAGWGLVRGILCGLGIPYQMVRPQKWQSKILEGMNRENTKAAAYQYASRRFPNLDYRATERSRVPHSGKVDALCIALYGQEQTKRG